MSQRALIVCNEKSGERGIRLTSEKRYVFTKMEKYGPKLVADSEDFRAIAETQIPDELAEAITRAAKSWHEMNGWGGYIDSAILRFKKNRLLADGGILFDH